jgi:hypothetical protein
MITRGKTFRPAVSFAASIKKERSRALEPEVMSPQKVAVPDRSEVMTQECSTQ